MKFICRSHLSIDLEECSEIYPSMKMGVYIEVT